MHKTFSISYIIYVLFIINYIHILYVRVYHTQRHGSAYRDGMVS